MFRASLFKKITPKLENLTGTVKLIPDAPPQVELKDLTAQGSLVVPHQAEIEKLVAIEADLSQNRIHRIRKSEIESKIRQKPEQGVIYQKHKDKLSINWIYKGGKLNLVGFGGHGKVKILFNENKWNVLKIKNISFEKKHDDKEFKMLEEKGLGIGRLVRLSLNSHDPRLSNKHPELQLHEEIIMPWVGEWDLFKLNISNFNLPTVFWIELILGMIGEVDNLHQSNKLHCDIKLCNFILDKMNQVKLIDFGMTCEKKTDKQFLGTPGYTAPELLASEQEPVTTSSDIYSLAMTIAQMLDLVSQYSLIQRDRFYLIAAESDEFKANKRIKDEKMRKTCLDFLIKMTARNPAERPALATCFKFFGNIFLELSQACYANVCIIKIDELLSEKNLQVKLLNAAKQFDMVWFFEQKQHTPKEHITARRIFLNENIWVGKYLFTQPNGNLLNLCELIKSHLKIQEINKVFKCTLVTSSRPNLIKSLGENGLTVMDVEEFKAKKGVEDSSEREQIIRLSI